MDTKDVLHIASLLLNAILLVLGYFAKRTVEDMTGRIAKLETENGEIKEDLVDVKLHYVHKEDMKDFKDELFNRLDRIEAILHK